MNGKWKGTSLFLAIFVVMGATFGLRLNSSSDQSAIAASLTQPGTPATTGGAAPATTVPSAAQAATGSSADTAATTITGDTERTRYGSVQVAVSFSGKTITGVTVVQIPSAGSRDQQVSQAVPPILEQEIISSQSATVNTVSGGTYTSDGYLQSVQSAIDKVP